jgi:hypothetical protein
MLVAESIAFAACEYFQGAASATVLLTQNRMLTSESTLGNNALRINLIRNRHKRDDHFFSFMEDTFFLIGDSLIPKFGEILFQKTGTGEFSERARDVRR